jgi:hypothetical protein
MTLVVSRTAIRSRDARRIILFFFITFSPFGNISIAAQEIPVRTGCSCRGRTEQNTFLCGLGFSYLSSTCGVASAGQIRN